MIGVQESCQWNSICNEHNRIDCYYMIEYYSDAFTRLISFTIITLSLIVLIVGFKEDSY